MASLIGSSITLYYAKHKLVFQKLYEKRFEVSATVFGKLSQVQKNLSEVLGPIVGGKEGERDKREEKFDDSYANFTKYFIEIELFLSNNIVNEINAIHNIINDSKANYQTCKMLSDASPDKDRMFKHALDACKNCEAHISQLKRNIRQNLNQKDL